MALGRSELKGRALNLREQGISIVGIEKSLGVPRSTLSGWFKRIKLTPEQKEILLKSKLKSLEKARIKASLWHQEQKMKRLENAKREAQDVLKRIDLDNRVTKELALALLYLGEGFKKNCETAIGNSDPLILRFFLDALEDLYGFDRGEFRYELYLRADQTPEKIRKYWSTELRVPMTKFKQVNVDKRTGKTKTYPHYKGVCSIRCGNVAIQRKLMYLSRLYCDGVAQKTGGT